MLQSCACPSINVSVTRAVSRLKTLFSILILSTQTLQQQLVLPLLKILIVFSIQCKEYITLEWQVHIGANMLLGVSLQQPALTKHSTN